MRKQEHGIEKREERERGRQKGKNEKWRIKRNGKGLDGEKGDNGKRGSGRGQ